MKLRKWSVDCTGEPTVLERPESCDICQRELQTVWKRSEREQCAADVKLEGIGNLKSPLTSNMEMQNLEFALQCYCLALVQYFSTMLLPSWNGSVHSVPCMLKYVTCLLILQGLQCKDCPQKEHWTFTKPWDWETTGPSKLDYMHFA